MSPAHRPIQVRTAFISDIHLGSRDCRTELVLDFLHSIHADELILVGDIVDISSLRRSPYWPQSHSDVLRTILAKAKHGTRVIYVPGNHDEEFRKVCGNSFGHLEVHREYVHQTLRGLRLLVVHGDEFDGALDCSRRLWKLGSDLYDVALGLNRALNAVRRRCGLGYWSLASFLKNCFGNAVEYVHRFEQAATRAARHRGLDGVVCGHIHRAAITDNAGVLYCNDGDWVDSCSALIERRDGELELWHWGTSANRIQGLQGTRPLASAA